MGNRRTYEYTCAIRSVNSIDAMTADWTRLPYETLATISNRIINEVRGINRVVYDISSKPPPQSSFRGFESLPLRHFSVSLSGTVAFCGLKWYNQLSIFRRRKEKKT